MIVGIDPSLACTGICLDGEFHVAKSKPSKHDAYSRMLRFDLLSAEIIRIMQMAGNPSIIVIEHYSMGSKSAGMSSIQEFGGILRHKLCKLYPGREFHEIPPATLKIFFTDKGNATKGEMAHHAKTRYKLSDHVTANDNLVDAFALYRIGMLMQRGSDEAIDDMERQGFLHVINPASRIARNKRQAKRKAR